MLVGKENNLMEMVEGDYGIVLPIKIENDKLSLDDKFRINIFKNANEAPIITKEYSNTENNTIEFMLTKKESELLPVGKYVYDLDWFQDDQFLGNLLAKKKFEVKDKAAK